jgi:hypothetical protein
VARREAFVQLFQLLLDVEVVLFAHKGAPDGTGYNSSTIRPR